jgi:hypothetical protein
MRIGILSRPFVLDSERFNLIQDEAHIFNFIRAEVLWIVRVLGDTIEFAEPDDQSFECLGSA